MKRTAYQQSLMDSTYAGIAIEAIKNGWEGAWERLIANRLWADCQKEHSEAREITDSVRADSDDYMAPYLRAAKLITSSTIQTHEKTT